MFNCTVYERYYHAKQLAITTGIEYANLLSFPPEIFEQFFGRLPTEDFFTILRVCKIWRQIALHSFTARLESLSPWTRQHAVAPLFIHGHSISSWISNLDEKKFFLYGGYNPQVNVNNSLYCFPKEGTKIMWNNKPDSIVTSGPAVFAHSASVVSDMLYIFGGSNGRDKFSNDLYTIDLVKMYFAKVTPQGKIPPARAYHRAVAIGKKIIIFGGQMTLSVRNSTKKSL